MQDKSCNLTTIYTRLSLVAHTSLTVMLIGSRLLLAHSYTLLHVSIAWLSIQQTKLLYAKYCAQSVSGPLRTGIHQSQPYSHAKAGKFKHKSKGNEMCTCLSS